MSRRSPPRVSQKYDTACTWRMFRIFNFREGHSNKRLVSNRKHLNNHDYGNGNSESSSNVLSTIDEKCLQIGVNSRRRKDYSCKSIASVENDQVADWRDEVTKMIVDQRFVDKYYHGKDGEDQFLDALQILYSNKELFIKLLQDPNSLLVKQIYDLQSSQVKEPHQQASQKRVTRLNKPQNSNSAQCVKLFEHSDRYDFRSRCKPRSSNRKVVLKPGKTSSSSTPYSPNSFSSNAQNIRPSHSSFSCIKRKLKHVMRVRRQEQQWRTDDEMPCKISGNSQGLGDGKKVKEMETTERNSPINTGKRLNSYLKLCIDQEAASFSDSFSENTFNTSVGPSEQNILNIHVEASKGPSQMINCGIKECKQCTSFIGSSIPLSDSLSLPSLHGYCEHSFITEKMRDYINYQMVPGNRLGVPKEGENDSYSFLAPRIEDPPLTIVDIHTDKLQRFGEDIILKNSVPDDNLHAHYDIPRDGRYEDSPTQNMDINNRIGEGSGSFLDLHPEIYTSTFSQGVASQSLSSCHRTEDIVQPSAEWGAESIVEQLIKDDVTNLPSTTFQPDESPVQVMHDKFEENHFEDLIRLSLDPVNNIISSKDILDYIREILHAFSLKCDELTLKRSCDQLLNPSTTDELKKLTHQLSGGTLLHDCVIETFMDVYQHCGFLPHVSRKNPNVHAYVVKKLLVKEITELVNMHFHPHPAPLTLEQLVEKDLARRSRWLNTKVDTEDFAIEVAQDVLEKLVLEIASEMDIRNMTHCSEPMSTHLWDDKTLYKDCQASTIFY